jgi:hypothetical protein
MSIGRPFDRAKTVHALDPAATVIGGFAFTLLNSQKLFKIRTSMFKTLPTKLCYGSTNWLAILNMNIPVNTTEYFID